MHPPAPRAPFTKFLAATGLQVVPLVALSGHLGLAGKQPPVPRVLYLDLHLRVIWEEGGGGSHPQSPPPPPVWGPAEGGGMHPQVHPRAASSSARAAAARFPGGGAVLHCPPPTLLIYALALLRVACPVRRPRAACPVRRPWGQHLFVVGRGGALPLPSTAQCRVHAAPLRPPALPLLLGTASALRDQA